MSVHAEESLTSLDNDTGLSSLLDRSCVFVSCLVSGEFEQQHTPSNENTSGNAEVVSTDRYIASVGTFWRDLSSFI